MRSLRGHDLRRRAAPLAPIVDRLFLPSTLLAGAHLRLLREFGIERLGRCRAALSRVGIFPIRDHYYEPLFVTDRLRGTLDKPRELPGIDFREQEQRSLLRELETYATETLAFPRTGARPGSYALDNGNFGPGDAEVLYSVVRRGKPRRFLEVGSGYSTLVVREALKRNERDGAPPAEHLCIEPYEMPWLEQTGVRTLRERVEDVPLSEFSKLERGDVLFIDSSHMIRPQGDVVVLYLRVLPVLAPGVLVHIHDIFTPFDYPELWLVDRICFWNEQYLLEALLTDNPRYRVLIGLHQRFRSDFAELAQVCPSLHERVDNPPKSFWIERV